MPEPFERDTELLVAWLEGTATDEERAELERRLPAEPELAERLALQARLSVIIEAEGRQRSHRQDLSALWWRRVPPSGRVLATVAAVLLVALAAWLLVPPEGPPQGRTPVRLLRAAPGAMIERGSSQIPARAGLLLDAGDVLRTAGLQEATLGYPGEATRIDLLERTEIYVSGAALGKEIVVRRGEVVAEASPQARGTALVFVTPHARAEVVGTRLALAVGPTCTRLEVREGRAILERAGDSASVEVAAGQFAVAERGRDLVARPSPGGRPRGLKGEYFDDADLTDLKVTRVDPILDFAWLFGAPSAEIQPDTFSVRWTGQLLPRYSETYTFSTHTDDGVRLWVNGILLIDRWQEQGRTERSASLDLRAWEPVDVRMEYFDQGGPAAARLSWSSPSTPKEVIPADCLLAPAPGEVLRGLRGEYFDNDDFTRAAMTRIDSRVSFTWGLSAPHPAMDPDYFSVRWTGRVEPSYGETYTFYVVSDDGVRLWVDGKLLIDDWKVRGTEERSGTVDLVGGRSYELKLEYFDCVSNAQVHLSWSSASQGKEVIPQGRLHPGH